MKKSQLTFGIGKKLNAEEIKFLFVLDALLTAQKLNEFSSHKFVSTLDYKDTRQVSSRTII